MSVAAVADVAVVGAGAAGLLVARELVRAGREVTVLERGPLRTHAARLAGDAEPVGPTAAPNHEPAPGEDPYPWDYGYEVGGCSLRWTGVAVRLLPEDFAARSLFGVGRDWPIGADELEPFYVEAERAMGVAGDAAAPAGGHSTGAGPSHPFAPVDRLLAPLLEPYHELPQARPTVSLGGRPPCTALARCRLCPTDARWTALHLLDDGLGASPALDLRPGTAVARLRTRNGRVTALECLRSDGSRGEVRARTVVLAANGIENAAVLLRSGLDDGVVGRHLYDHGHRILHLRCAVPTGAGQGASLATGISYAWAGGEDRARRAGALVLPVNPGLELAGLVVDELVAGRRGRAVHRAARHAFEHTLVVDTVYDDLPRPERRVELSPRRDALGLPRNRIAYPVDSAYVAAGEGEVESDLVRRLAPLGARVVRAFHAARGGHQMGTCYMGEGEGVVDANERHHRLHNLYVTGGSSFPAYSAAHPALTIAALAVRVGRHLGRS